MEVVVFICIMEFLTGMYRGNADNPYQQQATIAVQQCEQALPRNQHCEVNVTATIAPTTVE